MPTTSDKQLTRVFYSLPCLRIEESESELQEKNALALGRQSAWKYESTTDIPQGCISRVYTWNVLCTGHSIFFLLPNGEWDQQ
jgi:hypothetical protein